MVASRGPILAGLLCAAGALPALALSQSGAVVLKATLSGKAERPAGAPAGRGTATIKVAGTRVCWSLRVAGTDAPTAAHVHRGGPGVASGPVAVPLGKTFKRSGCTAAPAATARALVRAPGRFYVNVHTKRYPAGAVRGQLRAAAPSPGTYGSGDSSEKPPTGQPPGDYGGYGDYGEGSP